MAPASLKSGKRRDRYLAIWDSYVALKHPMVEYKHRGLFIALLKNIKQGEETLTIYTCLPLLSLNPLTTPLYLSP